MNYIYILYIKVFTYPSNHLYCLHNNGGDLQVVEADFVVLCIGRFSDVPNIPTFPPNEGPKAFKAGKVLHALEYSAMDFDSATKLIKDKEVTVVGFHKSAVDLAMECANTNGNFQYYSTTLSNLTPQVS